MPSFSLSLLGMIESLGCGVTAVKMKGEKLNSTRKLMIQGIPFIEIPLFEEISATASIACISVAIKSDG